MRFRPLYRQNHPHPSAPIRASLAALGLLCTGVLATHAQPPDPAAVIAPNAPNAPAAVPKDLPLEMIELSEFLRQNGGLSLLKLKMENATAREIAAEVSRQAGIVVTSEEDGGRGGGDEKDAARYSVEATGEPFWQAIANWNRPLKGEDGKPKGAAPKLSLYRDYNTPGRWRLVTWSHINRGLTAQAGPCTIVMSYATRSTSTSLSLDPEQAKAKPSQSQSLHFQASLLIDPKLRGRILTLVPSLEPALDDTGAKLAPEQMHNQAQLDNDDNSYLSISFKQPTPRAKYLRSLKGKLRLGVITKSEKWEIDLASKPGTEKTFTSGGTEVKWRFDGLSERLNGWAALVHIERKETGPRRIFKGGQDWNNIELGSSHDIGRLMRVLNAEGEALPAHTSNSRGGTNQGARTIDLEIDIRRSQNMGLDLERAIPALLAIDVPLEWREMQVPFEFKNIPLP